MNLKMFIYLPVACVFGLIYRFFNAPEKTQVPTKQTQMTLSISDSMLEVAENHYQKTTYSKAFELYKAYSNHNSFKGLHMRHFGMLYQWGRGCTADNEQAKYWYQKAIDNGDWAAQSYLQSLIYQESTVAHSIAELDSSVVILDLSDQQNIILPNKIFKYKNLKIISLRNCNLVTLPPEIFKLTQLEVLHLESNNLKTIPNEIKYLKNLKTLNLTSNELTSLPNELAQLTQLQFLDLGNNRIRTLPEEITGLSALRWLVIKNNLLKQVPPTINHLKELGYLNLNDNQLETLPLGFFQLSKLNELYLKNNLLVELPTEIRKLTALNTLDLSNNQLKKLPEVLCQMKLSKLNLAQNPYEIVPSCLR